MPQTIIQKLTPGDLRTTGEADEVAMLIQNNPSLVDDIIIGLRSINPGLRMRCADALEKASKQKPEIIKAYIKELIDIAAKTSQQEVQWHMAQILSYATLTKKQQSRTMKILFGYLNQTRSSIVKVFAIQTLFEIANTNSDLRHQIIVRLKKEKTDAPPAVFKRFEKLNI